MSDEDFNPNDHSGEKLPDGQPGSTNLNACDVNRTELPATGEGEPVQGGAEPIEENERLDEPLIFDADADVVTLDGPDSAAEKLPESPAGSDGSKPVAVFAPRTLDACVQVAENALAASGKFYALGQHLVCVGRDPATGQATMRTVTGHALKVALDSSVDWHKPSRDGTVRCAVPGDVLKAFADGGEFTHLLPVKAVARQPFLRDDGSFCVHQGYDAASRLHAGFGAESFDIPAAPTRGQATAALAELNDLLSEFPFRDPAGRSAALCAMLTAAVRSSLPAAPMVLVRAHQAGSGKSYLGRLIGAMASAQTAAATPFPRSAEECDKILLAALRKQPAVLEFDNVVGTLVSHASLCAAITADHFEGRELGRSSTLPVSTRSLILASGNNIEIAGDLSRRCLVIDLDPGVASPAERHFRRVRLLEEVMAQRGRFVSAALTIVRAWIVAGRPAGGIKPLVSFGQWSDWCREPLVWLGQPDPASSVFDTINLDPEREQLKAFIGEMERTFGLGGDFMVKDIFEHASSRLLGGDAELSDLIIDIAGGLGAPGRKRLGHWLKLHMGRIIDGRRLTRAPVTRNAVVWVIQDRSA